MLSLCVHVITSLISRHTDVRDMEDQTPLHRACVGGHIQVVKYLVEVLKVDVGESFLYWVPFH